MGVSWDVEDTMKIQLDCNFNTGIVFYCEGEKQENEEFYERRKHKKFARLHMEQIQTKEKLRKLMVMEKYISVMKELRDRFNLYDN